MRELAVVSRTLAFGKIKTGLLRLLVSNKNTSRRRLDILPCALSHKVGDLRLCSVTRRVDLESFKNLSERFAVCSIIVQIRFELQKDIIRQTFDEQGTHIRIPDLLIVEPVSCLQGGYICEIELDHLLLQRRVMIATAPIVVAAFHHPDPCK